MPPSWTELVRLPVSRSSIPWPCLLGILPIGFPYGALALFRTELGWSSVVVADVGTFPSTRHRQLDLVYFTLPHVTNPASHAAGPAQPGPALSFPNHLRTVITVRHGQEQAVVLARHSYSLPSFPFPPVPQSLSLDSAGSFPPHILLLPQFLFVCPIVSYLVLGRTCLGACSWALSPPSRLRIASGDPILSRPWLGHPDAGGRIQRGCKNSSVCLLTLSARLAATRPLPASLCTRLAAAKRGVGPGDHAHQLPYNTLRLTDETLFFIFVIILITLYLPDRPSVLGQLPCIRLGTLSLSTQLTFVLHSLLTSLLYLPPYNINIVTLDLVPATAPLILSQARPTR